MPIPIFQTVSCASSRKPAPLRGGWRAGGRGSGPGADWHTGLLARLHPYPREFPGLGASLTRKGTGAVVVSCVRLDPLGHEQPVTRVLGAMASR
jgi:hypothetical protein